MFNIREQTVYREWLIMSGDNKNFSLFQQNTFEAPGMITYHTTSNFTSWHPPGNVRDVHSESLHDLCA